MAIRDIQCFATRSVQPSKVMVNCTQFSACAQHCCGRVLSVSIARLRQCRRGLEQDRIAQEWIRLTLEKVARCDNAQSAMLCRRVDNLTVSSWHPGRGRTCTALRRTLQASSLATFKAILTCGLHQSADRRVKLLQPALHATLLPKAAWPRATGARWTANNRVPGFLVHLIERTRVSGSNGR